MMETISADVYVCDGCGKRIVCEEDDKPEGFHGTAFEVYDGGGSLDVHWFACRAAHIRAAVVNAVKQAMEES